MLEENLIETEIQEAPELPEISLENLKEGKISFRELPKQEKARLAAEARESLPVNEVAPVQNERIRSLSKEKEDLRKALEEQKAEMRKILEIQKMAQERTILSEEEKIQQELKDAEEFGDVGKYKAAEARRQILEQNKLKLKSFEEKPAEPEIPEVPREVMEWGARNPWYYTNREVQQYCIGQDNLLAQSRPDLSLSERLELVSEAARLTFPHMIPSAPTKPTVLPSRSAGTFSKPKTPSVSYDSLSELEKGQMQAAIRQGVFKDKAEAMKLSYNNYA
jgi:hypothetical protein